MKRTLTFLLIIMLLIPQAKAFADDIMPTVHSESAVVMDLNTGQILYAKNPHEKLYPASITKILTALITLEKCNLNDKVIAGKDPQLEDGSKIYISEGEEFTVEQLLYALLLPSANDAAVALAEHIAGSKAAFTDLMNAKAKELGCTDSHFDNPNGMPDDNHYTSAYDMALIAKKAMENPTFRKIVSTTSYEIPPTNKQPQIRYLHNQNRLLVTTKYKYDGADGVKTGYTTQAKNTFVGSATRGDQKVLVVIFKDEQYLYEDAINLLNYGFDNYKYDKIISKDQAASNIKIDSKNISIPVYPETDFYYTLQNNSNPVINKTVYLDKTFSSIKKGEAVGYLDVKINNDIEKKIPLIAGESFSSSFYTLKASKDGTYLETLQFKVIKLSFICLGTLILTLGFHRKYKRYKRKRREILYRNSRLF